MRSRDPQSTDPQSRDPQIPGHPVTDPLARPVPPLATTPNTAAVPRPANPWSAGPRWMRGL